MSAFALPDKLAAAIRGFQPSRVLLTALELDVFGQIGEGATAAELALRIQTDPRATEMLLNAAVSLGALEKRQDRFFPAPFNESFTGARRTGWLHSVNLWTAWSHLTESVRTGRSAVLAEIGDRDETWQKAFIAAMENSAIERAPRVAEAAGPEPVGRMLDVGGGSAAYSIAFARKHPRLHATVFDLPEILPLTERYIEAAGMTGRIGTVAGDLRRDTFGEGFDLVLLSSICHMLNEADNIDLLKRCRSALRRGGRIIIQEFILDAAKTGPAFAALFSLNMLLGTQGGAAYSENEYTAWLSAAGFSDAGLHPLPPPTALLFATAV